MPQAATRMRASPGAQAGRGLSMISSRSYSASRRAFMGVPTLLVFRFAARGSRRLAFATGRTCSPLAGGRRGSQLLALQPVGVGVKQKEKNEREGEDVRVEQEHDASMIEAPAAAQAAAGFPCAIDGGEGRQ